MEWLILDDWGEPLNAEQARDLWEVLDDRYQRGATIITSQVPVAQWHGLFADPMIADAVLDRVVHQAYRLDLRGESLPKTLPGRQRPVRARPKIINTDAKDSASGIEKGLLS